MRNRHFKWQDILAEVAAARGFTVADLTSHQIRRGLARARSVAMLRIKRECGASISTLSRIFRLPIGEVESTLERRIADLARLKAFRARKSREADSASADRSRKEAEELAKKINRHWSARGVRANAVAVKKRGVDEYIIKSNLAGMSAAGGRSAAA